MPADVIDQARRGLVEQISPLGVRRLLMRRRRLSAIEVRWSCDGGFVSVEYWTTAVPDVRPFLEQHGLAPGKTCLRFLCLGDAITRWSNVADYCRGVPCIDDIDLEKLVLLWERGDTPAVPDWSPAIRRDVGACWRELCGPGIPWAVLENSWQRTPATDCKACRGPVVLTGFGRPRHGHSQTPVCERICLDCLGRCQEPIADLSASCHANLDPGYRPAAV